MVILTIKALGPISLERDYRPGDTFSVDAASIAHLVDGEDYILLDGGKPLAQTDPAERKAAIIAAIKQLDPANQDVWLRDGKPDVSAIVAITGWPVSAAERNAIWDEIKPAPAA